MERQKGKEKKKEKKEGRLYGGRKERVCNIITVFTPSMTLSIHLMFIHFLIRILSELLNVYSSSN